MKAKIKFQTFDLKECTSTKNEGEIEFELDETYWRNEFAKAAMQAITQRNGVYYKETSQYAFIVADAMIEEMRMRKRK